MLSFIVPFQTLRIAWQTLADELDDCVEMEGVGVMLGVGEIELGSGERGGTES